MKGAKHTPPDTPVAPVKPAKTSKPKGVDNGKDKPQPDVPIVSG